MKIYSINTQTFNPYSNYKKSTNFKHENAIFHKQSKYMQAPINDVFNKSTLLNFNGGASLNLKSTMENLEFLGASLNKMERIFPPRVKEAAAELIGVGNPENFRLVDVHKRIFGKIKDCDTLSEIKALFGKEKFFDNVLSASDVEFGANTYGQKLINGENPYFTKDEDLSVQLIKLYWGDGFSLTDLKSYTDGRDINYLLNKLNIPKRDQHYGAYLKLSDEEYNTRITTAMKEKRFEAMDRKAAKEENEPIYIPRRPLSDLHKQHISEGLIRYYQENPLACYNISKRQREFYEKNPDQKLIFREVLNRAWNMHSAEGIKKALSKHLSRSGLKDFNFTLLTDPLKMDEKQSIAMKSFWAMNDWARKLYSKNMQHSWKTVKEELDNPPLIFNYPLGMIEDVKAFAKARGIELEYQDFATNYNTITKKHMYSPKFFEVYKEFAEESNNADLIAGLYQYSLVKSIQRMAKESTPQNAQSRKKILEFLTKKYQSQIYDLDPKTGKVIAFKELNIDQARTTFINVQLDLRRLDPELEADFVAQLSIDYPIVKAEALRKRKQ